MTLPFRLLCAVLAALCFIANATAATPRTVLVFGDSLSAGYGLAPEAAWPALLDRQLRASQPVWQVANASISGETSAGGRSRLAQALDQFQPQALVLALGANDGLRGLPTTQLADNLAAMIRIAKTRKTRVLLVGMRLPPNYGHQYTKAFEAVFRDVAREENVALLPFLLEPIAARDAAFQADRLHPVAAAQTELRDHVLKALKPLLR